MPTKVIEIRVNQVDPTLVAGAVVSFAYDPTSTMYTTIVTSSNTTDGAFNNYQVTFDLATPVAGVSSIGPVTITKHTYSMGVNTIYLRYDIVTATDTVALKYGLTSPSWEFYLAIEPQKSMQLVTEAFSTVTGQRELLIFDKNGITIDAYEMQLAPYVVISQLAYFVTNNLVTMQVIDNSTIPPTVTTLLPEDILQYNW